MLSPVTSCRATPTSVISTRRRSMALSARSAPRLPGRNFSASLLHPFIRFLELRQLNAESIDSLRRLNLVREYLIQEPRLLAGAAGSVQ